VKTKLIEFKTEFGNILRGIFVDVKSKRGVICLHGFERNATAEPKFKFLSDSLAEKGISSFRFDYTGTGISDGDFSKISIETMTQDLERAIDIFKKLGIKEFALVSHSLSGCVIGNYLSLGKNLPYKIVLLAPALNQKDLLRYYFVVSNIKDRNITWNNYRDFLDENAFLKDSKRKNKVAKAHYIGKDYFLENLERDYSDFFEGFDNVLLVYGDKDAKVPLESLNFDFSNKIIVKDGDHDLEKPDFIKQWLSKVVDFLVKF